MDLARGGRDVIDKRYRSFKNADEYLKEAKSHFVKSKSGIIFVCGALPNGTMFLHSEECIRVERPEDMFDLGYVFNGTGKPFGLEILPLHIYNFDGEWIAAENEEDALEFNYSLCGVDSECEELTEEELDKYNFEDSDGITGKTFREALQNFISDGEEAPFWFGVSRDRV